MEATRWWSIKKTKLLLLYAGKCGGYKIQTSFINLLFVEIKRYLNVYTWKTSNRWRWGNCLWKNIFKASPVFHRHVLKNYSEYHVQVNLLKHLHIISFKYCIIWAQCHTQTSAVLIVCTRFLQRYLLNDKKTRNTNTKLLPKHNTQIISSAACKSTNILWCWLVAGGHAYTNLLKTWSLAV